MDIGPTEWRAEHLFSRAATLSLMSEPLHAYGEAAAVIAGYGLREPQVSALAFAELIERDVK